MADWFRRKSQKIKTVDKKDIEVGLWLKCPKCGEVAYKQTIEKNYYVCNSCNHHYRISAKKYLSLIADEHYTEIASNLKSKDILNFQATKNYSEQLEKFNESDNHDAIIVVDGKINNIRLILAVMDFQFIGGSMGSVVGEKLCRGIDVAIENNLPLVIVTSSGGARMQEGAYSLLQLAKISSHLVKFANNKGLYITILTDPTTGGTTASFGMLGDIILAEPNALIGFAGQRVIKQTIGEDLPKGFQRSEFLLEKGFIDHIVHRNNMKKTLYDILKFFNYS